MSNLDAAIDLGSRTSKITLTSRSLLKWFTSFKSHSLRISKDPEQNWFDLLCAKLNIVIEEFGVQFNSGWYILRYKTLSCYSLSIVESYLMTLVTRVNGEQTWFAQCDLTYLHFYRFDIIIFPKRFKFEWKISKQPYIYIVFGYLNDRHRKMVVCIIVWIFHGK